MGKVVGFEMSSQQPEKAVKFYSAVFGWEFSDPQWGYWSVSQEQAKGETTLNGGISKGPHDYPHGTRIQIEVDSIDNYIIEAKKNGAMVVREKMEFDEFFLAYLVDPTGNGFSLIQSK
ncbi:VOC family protein [Oceanobacillus massiliensis]|uniref:VOC family protein n=1 Tax=Oceanobacillus massiliensis TaxID=1465765 RepID=UPI000287C7AB|nr:VOC family protein [Oceanobacillus massiliensis]